MPSSRLVKGVVLTSSCLLVGGYLVYAGGRSLMSGSKSARVFPEETPASQPAEVFTAPAGTPEKETQPSQLKRTMIYSSKSGRIVDQTADSDVLYADGHPDFGAVPPTTQPVTQPATSPATRRLIMGGSKSKHVFDAEDMKSMNAAPATLPAPPREMLPGSKSFQVQPKN
jgi:hypothetical protein